ncbi:MAG TPA: alpha/beta hydrolase [Myxococcaceae bacterium]|nr:alpha/beta hydrolase [Myxococcaceae bacterium]
MLGLLLSLALAAAPDAPEADAQGGRLLVSEGQPALWYKVAGPASAPVVVYLHGGPGYNSYDFERAVGRRLEKKLRMVYLDQRGSGRSANVEDPSLLGMEALVGDVERLRLALKVPKIGIIAHAFGGMIALEYAKRHPDHVRAMVLVETTGDLRSALLHQLAYLAEVAPQVFPARTDTLRKLATGTGPPSARLMEAYLALGPLSVQRHVQWPSAEAQAQHEQWNEESGLTGRGNPKVFARMQQEGYLDQPRKDVMAPLPFAAVLFAGRKSHAIGPSNLEAAAAAWKVGLVWFDRSGHRPYMDEPDAFATKAIAALTRR